MDKYEKKKRVVRDYVDGMNEDSSISVNKNKRKAVIELEGYTNSIIASFMLMIKSFSEKRLEKQNKTKSFENVTTEFIFILSLIKDFYEINYAEERLNDVLKNHNINKLEDLEVLLKVLQKVKDIFDYSNDENFSDEQKIEIIKERITFLEITKKQEEKKLEELIEKRNK